jgi:hypothetical protein
VACKRLHVVVCILAGSDPSGLTWQPWSDQLVYMVLGALVWGGLALQEGCPAEHSSLLEAVSTYMAARPMQVRAAQQANLSPAAVVQHC